MRRSLGGKCCKLVRIKTLQLHQNPNCEERRDKQTQTRFRRPQSLCRRRSASAVNHGYLIQFYCIFIFTVSDWSLTVSECCAGKVHGSLARAGKVRGQTPKVAKQDKKKKPRGRAHKRLQYNRRFVTAVVGFGKKRGPNSSEK
ncbi:hypothetical protein PS2_044028 [Malus domestica]